MYGLLCAPDGTPVAIEVFEGNTSDPQTIRKQIDKLKRRFKLSHVALVGDRGMITSARITEELAPAGLDWISCLRAPQIAALAADTGPLQLSLFDHREFARLSRRAARRLPQSGAGQGAREETRGASAGDGTSADPHCGCGAAQADKA